MASANIPDEKAYEILKDINPKETFDRYFRVDAHTKTKAIILTDKGIEVRNKLLEDGE